MTQLTDGLIDPLIDYLFASVIEKLFLIDLSQM